jgi:hypothetical protein
MQPNLNDSDLTPLVQHTLEDLTTIHRSLLAISEQSLNENSDAPVLDLETAGQLKNVVDALRLLLWAYIKALSAKSNRSPSELLSSYKTDLALEMLRSARSGVQDDESTPSDLECLINWAMVSVSR